MIPLKLTEDLRLMMRLRVFGSGVKQISFGGSHEDIYEYRPLRGHDSRICYPEVGPFHHMVVASCSFSDPVCSFSSPFIFYGYLSHFYCGEDY